MSNIYYPHPPDGTPVSTIPSATSKSSNGSVPSGGLPFAPSGQALGTTAGWDPVAVTATASTQHEQYGHSLEQPLSQPGQKPVPSRPAPLDRSLFPTPGLVGRSGTRIASAVEGSSRSAQHEARYTASMDQFSHSVHPAAAAAAAAAAAGAPGPHSASTIVFDPNDFPSLAGPSVSSTASAASLHANPVGNGGPGVALPSAGGLGLGVVGGGGSSSSNLGGQGPSVMSGLSGVAAVSELPHPLSSTDYADVYGLAAYGAGRGKAVDALTGANASSEFSMQSEDFPALGALGAKQPDSIFGLHPTAHLTNPLGASTQRQQPLPPAHSAQPAQSQPHTQGPAQNRAQQQLLSGPNGFNSVGEPMNGARVPNGNAPGSYPQAAAQSEKVQQLPQQSHLAMNQQQQHLQSQQQQVQAQWSSSMGREQGTLQSSSGSNGPGSAHSLFETAVPTSPKPQADSQQSLSQPSSQLPPEPASSQPPPQMLQHGSASAVQAQGQVVQQQQAPPSSEQDPHQSRQAHLEGQTESVPQSQTHTTASVELDDVSAPPVDEHGMMGLLRVLKPGSDSTDLFLLSVGLDLTQLGLNLNSPDPLHTTFESPWDDEKQQNAVGTSTSNAIAGGRSTDPDFKLPECYYMQPPALKTSHFTKFQLETLFYVFYNMPGDMLQLLAAVELNNREWRYHKDLKLWFTRAPGSTSSSYDRGPAYIYFDIGTWERRPFNEANNKFIAGLMTEEELTRMSNAHISNAQVHVRS